MPIIPRPLKAAGTNSYQGEVAAGKYDIIDAEVDLDFTTIYNLVNGKLDNLNIDAAGIKITYDKLNLTGQIRPTDLVSGFTMPAGTVYPANSVPGGSLTPGSVDISKLVVGAAVGALAVGGDDGPYEIPNDQQEHVVVEATWVSRGSIYVCLAALTGILPTVDPMQVAGRLRRDPSAPGVPDGQVLHTTSVIGGAGTAGQMNAPALQHPFSLVLLHIGYPSGVVAGSHRIQATVQLYQPWTLVGIPRLSSKRLWLLEVT